MLLFDEKKYAISLLNNKEFETYKHRDIERYVLIRYLNSEGMSKEQIKDVLSAFPLIGCEYLSSKDVEIIYDRIFERALSSDLVTGIQIKIFKDELDVIHNLEDYDLQKLLFSLLVYYKWAVHLSYLYFFSHYNNTKMVKVNDIDIIKLAGLMKYRVKDRHGLFHKLINYGLYVEDNFKSLNYFYLPFCKKDDYDGEIAMIIENYDNIIGEYDYYYDKNKYKRCEECGVVITKNRSPKKYCSSCAYKIKKIQNKKYYDKNKIHEKPKP